MKKLAVLIVLVTAGWTGAARADDESDAAASFHRANDRYREELYAEAAAIYEQVIEDGHESGAVYYNLGNAYFKLGEKGRAILNYERARRLIPRDPDLRSNLEYARSLTGPPISGFWVRRQSDRLSGAFSADEITLWTGVFYIAFLVLLALRLITRRARQQMNQALWTAGCLLAISVLLAGFKVHDERFVVRGVVTSGPAEARFAPEAKATPHFDLQEGAVVTVLMRETGWAKVQRPDGKAGWMEQKALTVL